MRFANDRQRKALFAALRLAARKLKSKFIPKSTKHLYLDSSEIHELSNTVKNPWKSHVITDPWMMKVRSSHPDMVKKIEKAIPEHHWKLITTNKFSTPQKKMLWDYTMLALRKYSYDNPEILRMINKALKAKYNQSFGLSSRAAKSGDKPLGDIRFKPHFASGEKIVGTKYSSIIIDPDEHNLAEILVHELGHSFDSIVSKRKDLSSTLWRRFKSYTPTEYAGQRVSTLKVRKPNEWFAEVYAMYTSPAGRAEIKKHDPELYAVMRDLFRAKTKDDVEKIIKRVKREDRILRTVGIVGATTVGTGTVVAVKKIKKKSDK